MPAPHAAALQRARSSCPHCGRGHRKENQLASHEAACPVAVHNVDSSFSRGQLARIRAGKKTDAKSNPSKADEEDMHLTKEKLSGN
jgi:hypothetical protein